MSESIAHSDRELAENRHCRLKYLSFQTRKYRPVFVRRNQNRTHRFPVEPAGEGAPGRP
jgi:hypothetical protein